MRIYAVQNTNSNLSNFVLNNIKKETKESKTFSQNQCEQKYFTAFRAYNYAVKMDKMYLKNIEHAGDLFHKIINTTSVSDADKIKFEELFKRYFRYIPLESRLLGRGFHESVYEFNKDYAIKVPHNYEIEKDDKLKVCERKFGDLNCYYGEVLATFGRVSFIKNLGKHTPAGIPYNMCEKEKINYYRNTYLPTFAEVPQESYNNLLADCAKLNKRYAEGLDFYCKCFDNVNSNNIVLKDNKLYWVDNIRSNSIEQNTTSNILNMMLNKYGINNQTWVMDGFGDSSEYARTIFDKIIIAGAENGLPLRTSYEKLSNKILQNIMLNLGIKEHPDIATMNIETINKIEDKTERVEKAKEYLSKI